MYSWPEELLWTCVFYQTVPLHSATAQLHLYLNIAELGAQGETKILIFRLVTDFVKIKQDCLHVCTIVYKKPRAKYGTVIYPFATEE